MKNTSKKTHRKGDVYTTLTRTKITSRYELGKFNTPPSKIRREIEI